MWRRTATRWRSIGGGAVKVEGEPDLTVRARDRGAELLLVETRGGERG